MLDFTIIDPIIKRALAEDLGTIGDLTTQAIIDKGMGEGKILARASGVLAGLPVARRVFEKVDPRTIFETRFQDGDRVAQEDTIAVVKGPLPGLLTAERTVLNFLQRLSGIATLTA
ncbi:nicotinate-nucleotide diphosphorylase (carboxylating), partial [candidate division KSB1 bacterium]|nr:nicotinate-nucleotide diphosphorylase (carboxylating) [candidate division KSB1 bacterium]